MDGGLVRQKTDELEENINQAQIADQSEAEIEVQIEIFASVLIEILLKDVK